MTTGTTGPDTLSTTHDGAVLIGRSGADRLTSTHTNTLLNGGAGTDTLTTDIQSALPAVSSITHLGGSGSDTSTIDLAPLAADHLTLSTTQVTGSGNDDAAATASLSAAHSTLAQLADTAAGDDTLALKATTPLPGLTTNITQSATMGSGNDRASLRITLAETLSREHDTPAAPGTRADILQSADGGPGNDSLSASLATYGIGAVHSVIRLNGGRGDDALGQYVYTPEAAGHFETDLRGGHGSDTLSLTFNLGTAAAPTLLTASLDAGPGNDSLYITVDEYDYSGDFASTLRVMGGPGRDDINAYMSHAPGPGAPTGNDHLFDGGPGSDYFSLTYEGSAPAGGPPGSLVVRGGGGGDVVFADLTTSANTATTIDGGPGPDNLFVRGGHLPTLLGGPATII